MAAHTCNPKLVTIDRLRNAVLYHNNVVITFRFIIYCQNYYMLSFIQLN